MVFIPPIVLFAAGIWLLTQDNAATTPSANSPSVSASSSEVAPGGTESEQPSLNPNRVDELRPQIDLVDSELYVVNKTRPFEPLEYEPADLIEIPASDALDNSRGLQLRAAAASALAELATGMVGEDIGQLFVNSAFRSYQTQVELFAAKVEQYGEQKALVHSAKPGHSEHQSGLAVDVSVVGGGCAILACFGQTEAGIWLAENSWRYGFIIRYPDGWQPTTGYTYEPWHLRYVGPEVAALYRESRKGTLEDFWGLPPAPDYLQ